MHTVAATIAALSASAAIAANSGLFGMSEQIQLGNIDVKAGTFAGLGSPIPYEAQAQELSSIDSRRGKIEALLRLGLLKRAVGHGIYRICSSG